MYPWIRGLTFVHKSSCGHNLHGEAEYNKKSHEGSTALLYVGHVVQLDDLPAGRWRETVSHDSAGVLSGAVSRDTKQDSYSCASSALAFGFGFRVSVISRLVSLRTPRCMTYL